MHEGSLNNYCEMNRKHFLFYRKQDSWGLQKIEISAVITYEENFQRSIYKL